MPEQTIAQQSFSRDELDMIRARAVEFANLMAQTAGRFDNWAKAYIALANAADRLDRLFAKAEGDEEPAE